MQPWHRGLSSLCLIYTMKILALTIQQPQVWSSPSAASTEEQLHEKIMQQSIHLTWRWQYQVFLLGVLKCHFKFPGVLYFPSLLKETAHLFTQEIPLTRDTAPPLHERAWVFPHQIQEHTVDHYNFWGPFGGQRVQKGGAGHKDDTFLFKKSGLAKKVGDRRKLCLT